MGWERESTFGYARQTGDRQYTGRIVIRLAAPLPEPTVFNEGHVSVTISTRPDLVPVCLEALEDALADRRTAHGVWEVLHLTHVFVEPAPPDDAVRQHVIHAYRCAAWPRTPR